MEQPLRLRAALARAHLCLMGFRSRAGSSMRVCRHCQPPRLQRLKPCSIHALKPYQQRRRCIRGQAGQPAMGCPSPQWASIVQSSCDFLPLSVVPHPCQRLPLDGTKLDSGIQWSQPSGRNKPCPLTRKNGMPPQSGDGFKQPLRVQATVRQHNHRPTGGQKAPELA